MNRAVLGLASLATAAIALWLITVSFTVLPARDPAHIPMWRGVAIAFLAYSAICGASLVAGPRLPWLRGTVLALSVAAMALGAYGVVTAVRAVNGHFEGYLLLMGVVLFGHGASGTLYHLLARGIRRRDARA
jgi:hypothetical protein